MRRICGALAAVFLLSACAGRPHGLENVRTLQSSASADQGDRAVLQQLRARGSNLSQPTDVVVFLYVPLRSAAVAAGADLAQRRFSNVEVREPTNQPYDGALATEYGVSAHARLVPSAGNVRKLRAAMNALAVHYGGQFAGWEAAVR